MPVTSVYHNLHTDWRLLNFKNNCPFLSLIGVDLMHVGAISLQRIDNMRWVYENKNWAVNDWSVQKQGGIQYIFQLKSERRFQFGASLPTSLMQSYSSLERSSYFSPRTYFIWLKREHLRKI